LVVENILRVRLAVQPENSSVILMNLLQASYLKLTSAGRFISSMEICLLWFLIITLPPFLVLPLLWDV